MVPQSGSPNPHIVRFPTGTRIATVNTVRKDPGILRRALELSLLLHLLLIFLLVPSLRHVWPATSALTRKLTIRPAAQEKPLKFELVDLPSDREEKPPADRRIPLSDMDRRAHGGTGRSNAVRPGTRGNTPQIIRSQGGNRLDRGAPPSNPGRRSPAVRRTTPRRPEEERRAASEDLFKRGVGREREAPPARKPAIQLPPPGAWSLPPDLGGIEQSPDRQGGQIDTGGLSFDTQWYNWGPYAAAMLRKIRRHWKIPEIAQLGVPGVAKLRFFIERDGTVTGLRIVDESGKPPMDFAARDAIATSSPFEPLPKDLTGVDREGVTITFFYNMNPSDERY